MTADGVALVVGVAALTAACAVAASLSGCDAAFADAVVPKSAPDDDGVELLAYAPPAHADVSVPSTCATSLLVDGACVPFRGTFDGAAGARDLALAGAPIATSFATQHGAPFEQRLQIVFRTDPRRRPSEGPTAALNLEVVFGGTTDPTGKTFACADADPLAVDPAQAVDDDHVLLNRDLHALQVVYVAPHGEQGGLASSFEPSSSCTLTVDAFPAGGSGRFAGSLSATLVDPNGAGAPVTVDGARFDVVLHAR